MKRLKLFFACLLMAVLSIGQVWGATCTLTSAQIKAGTGTTSYGSCSATDGDNHTWNAYAIKNQHSNATSDYHYWQIKKYASNTAYYVQVPNMGGNITSLKITVSNSSKARDGGGNTATLYFSGSNSTSATGTGVVSGTGDSEVTINCSSLNLATGYITSSAAVRIWDVEVTYAGGVAPVAVESVTLDESEITLDEDETQLLTATVLPNNATNPSVNWESDDESVATVVNGLVTAIGAGDATITCKSAADANKKATCIVHVNASPYTKSKLIFTSACSGSGTADDDAEWTVTSDGTESTYDPTCGIHYGTNSANVTYVQLATSDITGDVAKVVVNARDAQATATISVTVGGTAFTCASATATNTSADYVFTGTGSGEIVVRVDRGSSMSKAIYVKSVVVSYTPAAVEVKKPTFSVDAGSYLEAQSVELNCTTTGADIYYTLNGDDPDENSTHYGGTAIQVSTTTTIKAIAFLGTTPSPIASATYTIINTEHAGTLEDPYSVADAMAVIDGIGTKADAYVSGKISQVDSYDDYYKSITYWISDDGTTTNQLEVYSGKDIDGADFSGVDDVVVKATVVVKGKLKKYNDTYEFDYNNELVSYEAPAEPIVTLSPSSLNLETEGNGTQEITLTATNFENEVNEITCAFYNTAACDGDAISQPAWITNLTDNNSNQVSFDVEDNDGDARQVWLKVTASDGTDEASAVLAISQAKYSVDYATLPFAFNGGRANIETTSGMTQSGLDSDYGDENTKLKFNTTGDWMIIKFNSDPGKLTYSIKNNSFSGGTFDVQESADGETYTGVASHTTITGTQNEEHNLKKATRYVKFIYTSKSSGNVGLGNIAIAAPVAVETPTFSPAGGAYTGTQSVELSCTTEGATIYYTTNGDDPDNTKTLYEGAINVDATMTIKAIAYKDDDHSEIATATYTITPALTDYYEKVSSGDVAEGTYLIVYEAGNVAFDGGLETLDASSNTIEVEITNDNKIGVTPATAAATFYIDPTAGTIKSASGKYVGRTANSNGLNASATEAYTNTISIDGDGNAVIVGSGSTATYLRYNPSSGQTRFRYFTANQQAVQLYKLANEVVKPKAGLAWDPADDIELTVGDDFTAPTLLNPNNIDANLITISSSNENVATINNGVVELFAEATGTTTITATFAGNENYQGATVSYKIKVIPAHSISVSGTANFGSVEQGDALPEDKTITVALTNVAVATATLGGTNPDKFNIDKTALVDGEEITISVVSTATAGDFKATLTISDDAGVATSKTINISLKVTVPEGEETPVSKFSKWVAATEIADGMQVLIVGVNGSDYYAMGIQNNNNRAAVAGTLEAGVFTPGENTMAFTVVDQLDGTYALKTSNDKYLYAASSGSNHLKSQDEVNVNAKWTLAVASAVAEGSSNRNVMQFNSGSSCFACYSSASQKPIALYVPQTEAGDYVLAADEPTVVDASIIPNNSNVTISGAVTLIIDEPKTLGDLTAKEGTKVEISAPVTVNTFSICATVGGAGTSGEADIQAAITSDEVYADIRVAADDNNTFQDQWHSFTVPFPVDVMNGIYDTLDNKLTNEVNYAIMEYHSDIRANGQYGWKKFRGVMTPGTFYLITVDENTRVLRMKKTADGAIKANNSITMTYYGGSGYAGIGTDFGWCGVGNQNWFGGYISYAVQVLNAEGTAFTTIAASDNTRFAACIPFFIQVVSTSVLEMSETSLNISAAPARSRANEIKEMKVTFGNEEYVDQMYISANEDATNDYEAGKDLAKMSMSNTPKVAQIAAKAYNTNLSMINTPLVNDKAEVALDLYAPEAGEYTIAAPAVEGYEVYLTREGRVIWNLSYSEYVADFAKGNNAGYGIRIVKAPQVTTDIENGGLLNGANGVQKVIIDEHVYILRGENLYDINGKLVK